MNVHVNVPHRGANRWTVDIARLKANLRAIPFPHPNGRSAGLAGLRAVGPLFCRTVWSSLSFARILRGGKPDDAGRLGRYWLIGTIALAAIWVPAISYIKFAPLRFTSNFALILPGAGAASSINLAEIGQASSTASSAYSSPSISPTVTYKNLLMSRNVMERAAGALGVEVESLGKPQIKLVDETSFIRLEMTAATPYQARERVDAVMSAFFVELDKLRYDEIHRREASTTDTVGQYARAVDDVRKRITALQLKTGLNSIDQYNNLVSAAENLQTRVAEIAAGVRQHENSVSTLAATLNIKPEIAATTLRLHADPEFAALAGAASKAAGELAELGRQFGRNHPKVVEVRARYDGALARMLTRGRKITGLKPEFLSDEVDLSANGQRSTLMSHLVEQVAERDGLRAQLANLRQDLDGTRQRVAKLAETSAQLEALNREYKVAEAVFASALARISTSKTDIFASYPMAQVVEPPTIPWEPSSPNKLIAIGGAAAGSIFLMIGLGLGWLRRPLIDKLLADKRAAHA